MSVYEKINYEIKEQLITVHDRILSFLALDNKEYPTEYKETLRNLLSDIEKIL